jgi:beta-glucosidase
VSYTEGIDVGYRWYEARGQTPLFPFGYGLSYTTFRYSGLQVEPAGRGATVRVRVTNTGQRAGADVVELYVGLPASAGEPPRQLKGFAKVGLAPGAATVVSFTLGPSALSIWDGAGGGWVLRPGTYRAMIGDSSSDIRAAAAFQLR